MGAAQVTALPLALSPSPPLWHPGYSSRAMLLLLLLLLLSCVLVPALHPMTYAKIGELQNSRGRPALPVFGPLSRKKPNSPN